MRSFIIGLSCLSVIALPACSDESDDGAAGGGVAIAGNSATGAGAGTSAAGAGGSGAAGSSAAAPGGSSTGGTSSEVGVGGVIPLEPDDGSNGSGDGEGPGAAGDGALEPAAGDAGVPPTSAVCPPGPFPANPLDGAAAPAAVCTGLTFAEGTVWFSNLNTLFFSDFQLNNPMNPLGGRIMRFSPGGACEEFIPDTGTNGLVIAPDGNLLSARHQDRTLTLWDLDTRAPTVFLADNAGEPFNSPNDITIRSDGNVYFTDPNYLAAGRATTLPTRAYRIDPSGVLSVIDENGNPNGITLSPDENRLYLSHLGGGNDIVVFDIDASGAVSGPQPFANVGSDGMGIDCAGNLYTTGSNAGVQVFSPAGEMLGTIAAPGSANVAFGGADRRTLFIAAANSVLAVQLAIPGLPY